jgi:hypothetical protein
MENTKFILRLTDDELEELRDSANKDYDITTNSPGKSPDVLIAYAGRSVAASNLVIIELLQRLIYDNPQKR